MLVKIHRGHVRETYLFLIFPRGATYVVGGFGLSEVDVLGGDVSFLGFLVILLLCCSPLAISPSL